MKLTKFARLYEPRSEEASLEIRVRTLAGDEIVACTFQELAKRTNNLGMDEYDVVEVRRSDIVPEDENRPLWNKSIVVTVV